MGYILLCIVSRLGVRLSAANVSFSAEHVLTSGAIKDTYERVSRI